MCSLPLPAWVTDDKARDALPCIAKVWPLTKYERPVLIGRRAVSLSQGATPRVATASSDFNPLDVATTEYECGAFPPMRVMRYLPDETHVENSVQDLLESSYIRRM
jgi:DNA-directed RNA polymerase subunit K/omega